MKKLEQQCDDKARVATSRSNIVTMTYSGIVTTSLRKIVGQQMNMDDVYIVFPFLHEILSSRINCA
jgi:hypothetical protein